MTNGCQIIGLSGYARTGKDTAAAILAEDGWERVAFADALREALYVLDPIIDVDTCCGGWTSLRESVDMYGWEVTKRDYAYVRGLMQRMGTEVGRALIGDNVWVDIAMRKLQPGHKYVFTDVRFPNEAEAISKAGGQLWRIERPGTGPVNGHASETALDDFSFDIVIPNTGTLEDLKDTLRVAA